MAEKELTLVLKLSDPQTFQCSACGEEFAADGWVVDLVEAFQNHVRKYHGKH